MFEIAKPHPTRTQNRCNSNLREPTGKPAIKKAKRLKSQTILSIIHNMISNVLNIVLALGSCGPLILCNLNKKT
jgi:hypothetical protein